MMKSVYGLIGCILCVAVVMAVEPTAPVPKSGQVESFAPGDDGTHQAGVKPPIKRFRDQDDGTVLDGLTGLVWIKAPHQLPGNEKVMKWADAVAFCDRLEFAGRSDWRLPNVRELESLVDVGRCTTALPEGHPFEGIQSSYYWTGSSGAGCTDNAWGVNMYRGYVNNYYKSSGYHVWPVAGRR